MKNKDFAQKLINWYKKNGRNLPWRKTNDPYKIWLSEVILQQTRVDQGLPYFNHFINKFPNIIALSEAKENEVLRSWQGLGYYSRARNLHKCAKIIVEKYDGKFPSMRKELQKLPGIGPYTSAAIASLAFGKKEAVVDGNVVRVITRIYGLKDDILRQKTISKIRAIVDELIPDDLPDQFNQAIMEFGAKLCVPKNPACERCEFSEICMAREEGIKNEIPYKSKSVAKRIRYFNYLIINIDSKYLLRKRIKNDIWQGLFEFFLIESNKMQSIDQFDFPKALVDQHEKWSLHEDGKTYKHVLTHQIIMCNFFKINTNKDFKFYPLDWREYRLYSREEIDELPKSILIDRYLEDELFD